ncbi:MAG: PPC domain-containing protein [Aggregatilineales bacterium]
MDACHILGVLALAALLLAVGPTLAQQSSALDLFRPVEGTLGPGESQRWTFSAADGAVLSFVLRATSGNLDPVLRIANSAGVELIANDDYDYPNSRDALLEAITIPRLDTYTVTVSGHGGTAGAYQLTLLAGYAEVALHETFDFDDESAWDSTNPRLTLNTSGGQLALQLGGPQERAVATLRAGDTHSDFFARVQVAEVTGRSGWAVGLTARQQNTRSYYLFQVNHQGQWRFLLRAPLGDRTLRDWATHPAIAPGATAFTLSVMASDNGFDLFYNDLFLSRVLDDTLTEPGMVGLSVETASALDSLVTARFETFSLTTPMLVDGARIVPDRLIVSRDGRVMARELQRRHLIPAAGDMRLTVLESFVTFSRPGVNRIALASGQSFRGLAIGTTFEWQIGGAAGPAGCGLVVRAADDTRYVLAYLDQTGGYGASERSGDKFAPGIFGEQPGLSGSTHHLLLIASGPLLRYYVNGRYAGALEISVESGGLAVAAVNFEPANTSCTFRDTWLWSWD